MRITIQSIPYTAQRYPTVGDWQFDAEGNLTIKVSAMSDHRYEFLVALHEMVEAMLCKQNGVAEADVDAFDIQFEKDRAAGLHSDEEVGDDPRCPCFREHQFASLIEKLTAAALAVDWRTYNDEVDSL